MPKIPLYARGMGSQVDLATGSLGPSAPTEAFAAPGQAMARAGQAIGQTGRQFAKNMMEFDNASKDLEFKFQKARKDEQTKTLAQKYSAQAYEQSDTYTLESTESDMDKMVSGLTDSVQTPILNEIKGLGLTPSQTTAISDSVLQTMRFKTADAKKVSFQNMRREGSAASNAALEADFQEASRAVTLEDLSAITANGLSVIDDGAEKQYSLNYSRKSFTAEVQSRFFNGRLRSVDNFVDLKEMDDFVSASSAFASESIKQGILSGIEAKRTELEDNKRDEVRDILLGANLTGDEKAQALVQMRDVEAKFVSIEREDEIINIDLRETGAKFRTALASQFEQDFKNSQATAEKQLVDTIFPTIVSMNRNELNALKDEAETLTGRLDGADRGVAKLLIGDVNDRLKKMDAELEAQIRADTDAIKTKIISSKGVIDESTEKMIQNVSQSLGILGEDNMVPQNTFNETMDGLRGAGVLYSSIKFGGPTQLAAARRAIKDEITNASTGEETRIAGEKSKSFEGMVSSRKTEIENDPVKFIQEDFKDQEKEPATTEDLISLQRQMGIAPIDIRLTSNAELTAFQAQYNAPELTAKEKSELGIAFISKFGIENEDRIMRNLMASGVFGSAETALSNSFIIANPDNVGSFDVEAANRPEVVKSLKDQLGSTTIKEITAEVMTQNAEYTGSVIGGMSDSVVSRGATGSRMLHTAAMNGMISNVAAYYMQTGLSVEKAVEKALDTVVYSQFSFAEVNGKPLRMVKGFENSSAEIGNVLNSLVSDEKSREMIVGFANIPPVSGNVDVNQKYKEDLAQGYWVTTSDHKGAYLVDQTGNMVTRRIDPGPTAISPDQAFVTVKFSDILPLIAEIEQATGTAAQKITRRNEIARRLLQ